jgi:poly-gamma-glutamate synthesis protein (capsule biosynthesis protein)
VHEPPEIYSTLVSPVLATGDLRFAQSERMFSERGAMRMHGFAASRMKPDMASVFTDCGIDIVSLAGNHTMHWGDEVLFDTLDEFRKRGITVIGAGHNIEEARRPAIFEKNGVRIAMLAYCSVMKEGDEAGPDKPGVVPIRVATSYERWEYQPGIPPHVITVPDKDDVAAMVRDIKAVKKQAHVVIVSLHWGVHYVPRVIAEYQPIVAQAAFDAGADLILGHHPHIPKAIEVRNGKVCFYSLSNFIMSSFNGRKPDYVERMRRYGVTADLDEYPNLPGGVDCKRSLIARIVLSREGVRKVSFLPVHIDKQLRPEVLLNGDPRFTDAVRFMEWVSEGFVHKFRVEGNEVIVEQAV